MVEGLVLKWGVQRGMTRYLKEGLPLLSRDLVDLISCAIEVIYKVCIVLQPQCLERVECCEVVVVLRERERGGS